MNILTFIIFVVVCGVGGASQHQTRVEKSSRQKRLLFYDAYGHLVKTYNNPFYRIGQNEQENLFYWSFLNTLYSPIFPTNLGRTAIVYMVPVSDAVIQQIYKDPIYQNKILVLANKEPEIEKNPLCDGKRAQIPSLKLCGSFLNCWDGWALEQECPDDLLFSKDGFCDYPQNVDCGTRILKNPHPLCSKDNEAYRNEDDCTEFFVCVSSKPIRFKCPAGLYYSTYRGVCIDSLSECNLTSATTKVPDGIKSPHHTSSTVPQPVLSTNAIPTSPTEKNSIISKMEYNTQSWSSTHVAISRQDAIKKLKLARSL